MFAMQTPRLFSFIHITEQANLVRLILCLYRLVPNAHLHELTPVSIIPYVKQRIFKYILYFEKLNILLHI